MSRLALIGLEGVDPDLVYKKWIDDLPTLKALMGEGIHGTLRSTFPPVSVPAWTSMVTSQDPGQLGIYGYRNRVSREYEGQKSADSHAVRPRTIWNYLSKPRLHSLVVGVPQTWPPKPLKGGMVSGFLTPNKEVQWTYPRSLAAEVDGAAEGDYVIDVRNFRTDNKDWLMQQLYESTRRRFAAVRHFVRKKEFDFMMMVEMGPDRVHHGFWGYMDPKHPDYVKEGRFETAVHDYYVYMDQELGKLFDDLPIDTSVMVVSDHGAKRMDGAFCVNDWLIGEKLLKLKKKLEGPTGLDETMISWPRTKVWAEGGYVSRFFMNVEGREPKGTIPADEYESFRENLKAKLEAIAGPNGRRLGVQVYKPEDTYRETTGIAPDLVAVFGDYSWRCTGSVGNEALHMTESEDGPDSSNHVSDGIFIWDHPAKTDPKKKDPYSIYDIAPTILEYFGIDRPELMIGESLF